MHVLVTGATGFLGRHLVLHLLKAGHTVRALARNQQRAAKHLPREVEVHVGDLTDATTLNGLSNGVNAVIHLAAATAGDWPAQRRATVDGTAALLDACRAANVTRFIHVSTIAVYDTTGLHDGQTLAPNASLAAPTPELGPYARAKLEAELLVHQAALDYHLQLTVARPGLVYGPSHVLFEHLGKPLPLINRRLAYGSSRQRLPLVHVDSVAQALTAMLTNSATINQTYNLVDPAAPTRAEYLKLYRQLTGQPERAIYVPAAPLASTFDTLRRLRLGIVPPGSKIRTRALSLHYDTANLQRDTTWQPPHTLDTGLADALERTPGQGRPLRIAIVGAGMNAGYHIRPLLGHRAAKLIAIVDKQRDHAAKLAKTHNIPLATDSLDELFDKARPDVVHLVTPPQTHADLACQLMQRGADVLCEKPLAMNQAECQRIARTAADTGRSLAVNHNLWFDPRLIAARRLVASGAIGDLVHIDTYRAFAPRGMASQPQARAAWLNALPGGLLEDILPHPLYTTLGFLPNDVQLTHAHTTTPDELRLTLASPTPTATATTPTAHLTVSLNARPDTFTLRLHGTKATLHLDMQNMLLHLQRPRLAKLPRALDRAYQLAAHSTANLTQSAANALRLATKRTAPPGDMTPLIHHHLHCLLTDQPFPLGPQQGEQVVAFLEQIWPRTEREPAPPEPHPAPTVPALEPHS